MSNNHGKYFFLLGSLFFLLFIDNDIGEENEEVMVVEENVPQPHIIETGDSVKVKQVLDDALMAAITDTGFEANYSWDNMKLLLMFLSCVFAMVAQFYPLPFPESRILLFCCCAAYFIISFVLQIIVVFVDKDTIMFTKANQVSNHFYSAFFSFTSFCLSFFLSFYCLSFFFSSCCYFIAL
jgi:hypothetical protein